jgi:citrate lyase subunit beta/citryl-CoA lyase
MSDDHSEPAALTSVRGARSWLFVPGDRNDRFTKASNSGADLVVYDLEDAVAGGAKDRARAEVAGWLRHGGTGCVRVNSPGSPRFDADVTSLAGAPGLHAVMVPKAEDPRALSRLTARLGPDVAVVALVETALGVHRVHDLAAAPGVTRLAFGSLDFALEIGADHAWLPLLSARTALVMASRLAGLPAPVDGITQALDDPAAVRDAAAAAASLGFGGKLCIHPQQVSAVHDAFRLSEQEIQRARRIVAAFAEGGAGQVQGHMIDRPVVERARQVLRRAAARPDASVPHDTRSA